MRSWGSRSSKTGVRRVLLQVAGSFVGLSPAHSFDQLHPVCKTVGVGIPKRFGLYKREQVGSMVTHPSFYKQYYTLQ
jgi:hypothetical protein